jgi:hypothetical protein
MEHRTVWFVPLTPHRTLQDPGLIVYDSQIVNKVKTENGLVNTIRPLENRLSYCCCSFVPSAKFTTLYIFRTAHARGVSFRAVVSQDHSAVSVSTVRLGVQFRPPKAASPPQELEVRAAGGRANF